MFLSRKHYFFSKLEAKLVKDEFSILLLFLLFSMLTVTQANITLSLFHSRF